MSEGETKNEGGSSREILEKALQKAIDGGWNAEIRTHDSGQRSLYVGGFDNCTSSYHGDSFPGDFNIIFNHDFAKALWGDDGFTTTGLKCSTHEGVTRYWQYHLQQMVIADDPIKYLGENI